MTIQDDAAWLVGESAALMQAAATITSNADQLLALVPDNGALVRPGQLPHDKIAQAATTFILASPQLLAVAGRLRALPAPPGTPAPVPVPLPPAPPQPPIGGPSSNASSNNTALYVGLAVVAALGIGYAVTRKKAVRRGR